MNSERLCSHRFRENASRSKVMGGFLYLGHPGRGERSSNNKVLKQQSVFWFPFSNPFVKSWVIFPLWWNS